MAANVLSLYLVSSTEDRQAGPHGGCQKIAPKETQDLENRLVVAKKEGEGVGWDGSLGLVDNYLLL